MQPEYYRARIAVIGEMLSTLDADKAEKGNEIALLRNGVFPKQFGEDRLIEQHLAINMFKNDPLAFSELTRFNTWFAIYPEKVCGKEVVTTSIEFPLTIKGSKEDIIKTITCEIIMSELEIEALATEVELQLLRL